MKKLLELTYSIDQDSVSPSELLPLCTAINELFDSGEFNQVNQFLIELNIAKASTISLIGILRLSSPAEQYLPNWMNTVICVYYELITRGEDPEILLSGLKGVTDEAYLLATKVKIKTNYTNHIIQLVGIELTDINPKTRRLAEQIVEQELKNPNRRPVAAWANSLSKYICNTYNTEEK